MYVYIFIICSSSVLQQTPTHEGAEGIALTSCSKTDCYKEFKSCSNSEATMKKTTSKKITESPILKKRKKQTTSKHTPEMGTPLKIKHLSSRRSILSELSPENNTMQTSLKTNDTLKLLEKDTLSILRRPEVKQKLNNIEQDLPTDDEIIENSPKQLSCKKKHNGHRLKGRQLLKNIPQSNTNLNIQENADSNIKIISSLQDSNVTQAESSNSPDQKKEDCQTNNEINDVTFFEFAEKHPNKQLHSKIHSNTKEKVNTFVDFDQSFDVLPSTKKVEQTERRRCRAERKGMKGYDCWCCHEYYQDFGDSDERRMVHQKLSSRHKSATLKRSRKDSQDFWYPLFPETASESYEND